MVRPVVSRLVAGALVAAALVVQLSDHAGAHEVNVHALLTDAAVDYLIKQIPAMAACGRPEVRMSLKEGAVREDDYFDDDLVLGRFMFHFLPQLNDTANASGLSIRASSTCDSLDWARGTTCFSAVTKNGIPLDQQDNLAANEYPVARVVDLLKAEPSVRKTEGWKGLGHFLHLVQDLTSPAHTLNDAHPPSPYNPLLARPGFVSDPSAYEVVNMNRPEVVHRFRPLPWTAPGNLILFDDPFVEMERWQKFVSERYPSEGNVNRHDAVQGRRQPPDLYVRDAEGRRIAVFEWGTREFAIDRNAALDQFDSLAPYAIQYTASMINHFHTRKAPVCEQELRVLVHGPGKVTSTADGVRQSPFPERISCDTEAAGSQTCAHYFPSASSVTLIADGDGFKGWSDKNRCPGTGPCTVEMNGSDAKVITADFGGDPVSGVYDLVTFAGFPLPTPQIRDDQFTTFEVLEGVLRLNELGLDGSGGLFSRMRLHLRIKDDPFLNDFDDTVVSDFHNQWTLGGSGSAGLLPPFTVFSWGTLAADGRTLSMQSTGLVPGLRHYPVTFLRRPLTRVARIEPADSRSLTFPDTVQGTTSEPLPVVVTNTGTEPLTVRRFLIDSLNFGISANSCAVDQLAGKTLERNESCRIDVVFKPELTYRQGARSGTLTLETNRGSTSGFTFRTTAFALTGSATGAPTVSVSSASLTFPATPAGTESAPQVVTIRNIGELPLRVGFVVVDGNFPNTGCRNQDLAPGGSCTVSIRYSPGSGVSATLRIQTNTGSTDGIEFTVHTVPLTAANSIPVADAGADRSQLRLGQPVFLSGLLSSDAELHPLTYIWSFVSRPQGSAAVLTDAASPTPSFTPDIEGTYALQLVVNDGFANSEPDTVSIGAEAAPGFLIVSPLGLSFVTIPLGQRSVTQSISLTNTGGRDVAIAAITVTGDFGSSGNTCGLLAKDQTCTIDVFFAPTLPVARTGAVTITSNGSNSPTTVSLSGGAPGQPGGEPQVVGNEVHVVGDWRIRFEDGDADDFWLGIGSEPLFNLDEDFVREVFFGVGLPGVFSFREDAQGLPPPTLIEVERLDENTYLIKLDDDEDHSDIGLILRLERLPG